MAMSITYYAKVNIVTPAKVARREKKKERKLRNLSRCVG